MTQNDPRPGGLLAWQWDLYGPGHSKRSNLLIHILAVPVFQIGTLVLLSSVAFGILFGLVGVLLMTGAMAAQGKGHAGEAQAPVPFRGPGDVLARIFAEQWITFPRYVLSGGFAKAWTRSVGEQQK